MSNLIIILLLLFIKLNYSQTDKGDNKIEPGNSQIFFSLLSNRLSKEF